MTSEVVISKQNISPLERQKNKKIWEQNKIKCQWKSIGFLKLNFFNALKLNFS